MNAKKTEAMAIAKNTSQRPYAEAATVDITIGDTAVHQVSNFTYLGTIISSDGTIDRDLSARIQKASGAYNQLSNIWKNRNIQTDTKIRIYASAVLTILLYGTWERGSPNQVLTHAARAAAKQLNKPPLVAARGAREGLWLEQGARYGTLHKSKYTALRFFINAELIEKNSPCKMVS